jgi:hypothetical protein
MARDGTTSSATIDFTRDIRPILADNCLTCHGPDDQQRKAKLRLDRADQSLSERRIVVPGKSAASALLARVTAPEDEQRMPPPKTGKRLTAQQIEILRRWIDQGAKWSNHWAYSRPEQPTVPSVRTPNVTLGNPIDAFILARLAKEGLSPSPEADRSTLLRRVTLDLTGLPPTLQEVDAFLADTRPDAYERLVDRLLSSPHLGERMAQHWLDLARFGDSDGYHDDTPRIMYQYRDYVIQSFNRNKPFDQFTLENLAGDLLPAASLEERIGSAFHRLGPTSSEGGADAKEYLAKYAVDRVNTTASVWLGVTLHCAECHDHKYDPFTTREYYQLFAFFNQVPEDALFRGNEAPPVIPTPTPEQQQRLDELTAMIDSTNQEIAQQLEAVNPELDLAQQEWEKKLAVGGTDTLKLSTWQVIGPFPAKDGKPPPFEFAYPPEEEVDLKKTYEDGKLKWVEQPNYADGKAHYFRGENCATYLYRTITSPGEQALTLYLGSDDGIKVWHNGKLVHSNLLVRGVAPNQDKVSVVLQPGENRLLMKIVNLQGGYGFYFSTREKARDEPLEEAMQIAKLPPERRTEQQRAAIRRLFRDRSAPAIAKLKTKVAEATQQKATLERAVPKLRIMADLPQRRPTHVLVRGDFRKLGEAVEPDVPAVLGALKRDQGADTLRSPAPVSPSRLDLARWLVSPEQPLTARVVVNRFWQMLFGQGLVRTPEDFGVRGELPSHPELLDWLACEFASPMQGGAQHPWDVKHLLRLMVTSSTYRQSSKVSKSLLERDPQNVLLARGPRFRLPAEMIRDNALAISGLLDRNRLGGPSVKPYQPGDLWREMSYGDSADKAYLQDHGRDLYRRGIYTYWKRSIHYPSFAVFDAPNREVCVARRAVTNTPLQAFVTLNDVTFVEAARVFAQNVLRKAGPGFDERIDTAFRQALARHPRDRERSVLRQSLERLLTKYRDDPEAARKLTSAGEYARTGDVDLTEHAAWTSVCQMLLNLDETLTRE